MPKKSLTFSSRFHVLYSLSHNFDWVGRNYMYRNSQWSSEASLTTNFSRFQATYYGDYPGGGACSLDPLSPMSSQPGWIRVAAGAYDFQNSLGCGMCVEIKGSGIGSGSDPVTGVIKAVVHDLCGGCGKGSLDLCGYKMICRRHRKGK